MRVRLAVLAFLFKVCDTTETTSLSALGDGSISPAFGQLRHLGACQYDAEINRQATGGGAYTLGEIDVDPMVVDEHSLHLEIGLLAVLLVLKLDERILQTVTGALVSNDFAG